jgi:hypothetical protein
MAFPNQPCVGQYYADVRTGRMYAWSGLKWEEIGTGQDKNLVPSQEQLDMYPTLDHAWNEYLVIRRLLGI